MKKSRKDQEFKQEYAKNEVYEMVLNSINENLRDSEEKLDIRAGEEKFPSFHVTGLPRSGTTFVNQYLASTLEMGYINNLIAAFWNVPVHGIHLSNELLGTDFISNYDSDFGKTNTIKEPHEFGYFWSKWLNYAELKEPSIEQIQSVRLEELVEEIHRMTRAFGKGIVLKSIFLTWFAKEFIEKCPETLFIQVKRNWMDNAISLLNIRSKFFESINSWASFKPKEYEELKDLDAVHQVVGQVYYLNRRFDEIMAGLPDKNRIIWNYEDFVHNPGELRDAVIEKSRKIGTPVDLSSVEVPHKFSLKEKNVDEELKRKMIDAYEYFDR